MVWLSAILCACVFLYNTPMGIFVRAAYDEPMGAWISVGFVLQPWVLERTVYISHFPKKKKKVDAGGLLALRAFHGLWKEKNAQLDVKLEIGSADAAATAILCGSCYALASNFTDRAWFRILPLYAVVDPHYALRGMLWSKTGHIVIAAFAYWREKRRKENGEKAH